MVLKPRDGQLPSFFQVGRYKASLFFTGRVSCCPYCERQDHLGRDCPRKNERRCFTCGHSDHFQRDCPDRHDQYRQRQARIPPQEQEQDGDNNREQGDSMEINGEQAAESDSTPSMSNDLAGNEKLSDGESSYSSDTLIEAQEAQKANNTAAAATTTPPPTDEINIVKVKTD